jgi:hypothetical protein
MTAIEQAIVERIRELQIERERVLYAYDAVITELQKLIVIANPPVEEIKP